MLVKHLCKKQVVFLYLNTTEAANLLQNLSLDSNSKSIAGAEPVKKVTISLIILLSEKDVWLFQIIIVFAPKSTID